MHRHVESSGATAATWGPFTGRQLTTMVCVVAAVVLFPTAVWGAATALTKVTITDPAGANQAQVDASGHLDVGDGSGPLTVDGTVTDRTALPAKPIVIAQVTIGNDTVLYGPQSKPFGITSLTAVNACTSPQLFTLESDVTTVGVFPLYTFTVPASAGTGQTSMVDLPFPTPLVTTPQPGTTATLQASASSSACVYVTAVGLQS